jgi:exonuclease III
MSHRIPSALNIISWNVASWSTTAGYIAKYHGSVSNWLDRHHIDILCLQEVKATRQKILATPVCHLNPSHWDMFLSPSVSRPGLNGVATLVRRNRVRPSGTGPSIPTLGADPRPLGVELSRSSTYMFPTTGRRVFKCPSNSAFSKI